VRTLPPSRRILGLLLLHCLLPVAAHAAAGSRPLSFTQSVLSDEAIDHRFLRFVDVPGLLAEDAATSTSAPFRVAAPVQVDFALARTGTREALPGGGTLWRLRVTSPGAVFLSFMLADFALPPGAELRFYSPARAYEDGPYTARDGNPEHRFGSPAIPGDSAVIELYTPPSPAFPPSLTVESVSHGYRDFLHFARVPLRTGGAAPGPTAATAAIGACEVDVNCPEGAAWQAQKRAVARTYDGQFLCTGELINNVRQDCRNFFLTAHHCISSNSRAAGMVFYWNYENSTCGGGDASLAETSTGSSLRATAEDSDFTLLELNIPPARAFNVYYGGFDRSGAAPTSAAAIHHPAGAAKKITFENDPIANGGDFADGFGASHWRVTGWDVGTTEGGSSGCALWNQDHRIVGQLHGGTADCSGGWDEFGKLSESWSAGLADWLDPDHTGARTVNGRESRTCKGRICRPGRVCP
jgi:lysyl endopeptidase